MTTNTKSQHPYHQALKWIADGESIQGFTEQAVWTDVPHFVVLLHCAEFKNDMYFQPNELRLKPARHVHQELIDAHKLGAKIQFYSDGSMVWKDINCPLWDELLVYRIKPTPKPDVIGYCNVSMYSNAPDNIDFGRCSDKLIPTDNLKLVFCGETLNLKSVEMIKGKDNDTV